ncbi:hypothetical protein B0H11DRAFT_1925187 [Mycena galericulata]|nr:hypothetical protein B0H11DRAFT_1925187 [Mycena galericulata]
MLKSLMCQRYETDPPRPANFDRTPSSSRMLMHLNELNFDASAELLSPDFKQQYFQAFYVPSHGRVQSGKEEFINQTKQISKIFIMKLRVVRGSWKGAIAGFAAFISLETRTRGFYIESRVQYRPEKRLRQCCQTLRKSEYISWQNGPAFCPAKLEEFRAWAGCSPGRSFEARSLDHEICLVPAVSGKARRHRRPKRVQ